MKKSHRTRSNQQLRLKFDKQTVVPSSVGFFVSSFSTLSFDHTLQATMDNDCFSRKSKLCKFLSCGCRRTCSCKSAKPTDNSAKQYPYGAGYWSPYPGPWVPSWFDNTDKPGEQRVPGEIELYRGGRFVFPIQSRRTHRNESATIPCSPILRPEHSVVGHPSLKIYRFRLPPHLLPLLDLIKDGCCDHANSLPSGWM